MRHICRNVYEHGSSGLAVNDGETTVVKPCIGKEVENLEVAKATTVTIKPPTKVGGIVDG
jgi:hypothetical protein